MRRVIYLVLGALTFIILSIVLFILIKSDSSNIENILPDQNQSIRLSYPVTNNSKISSPLVVTGEARGNWFFEASFPVVLTNWDGLIIAEGIAKADGDWMTTDFVPFKATLSFSRPDYGDNGFLILKKDNPSGLSQFDDALEIPIIF